MSQQHNGGAEDTHALGSVELSAAAEGGGDGSETSGMTAAAAAADAMADDIFVHVLQSHDGSSDDEDDDDDDDDDDEDGDEEDPDFDTDEVDDGDEDSGAGDEEDSDQETRRQVRGARSRLFSIFNAMLGHNAAPEHFQRYPLTSSIKMAPITGLLSQQILHQLSPYQPSHASHAVDAPPHVGGSPSAATAAAASAAAAPAGSSTDAVQSAALRSRNGFRRRKQADCTVRCVTTQRYVPPAKRAAQQKEGDKEGGAGRARRLFERWGSRDLPAPRQGSAGSSVDTETSGSSASATEEWLDVDYKRQNVLSMVMSRESHARPFGCGFSKPQKRHIAAHTYIPAHAQRRIDMMQQRAYIGQFNDRGDLFVATFQDRKIKVYDVERRWRVRKSIDARNARWTVTDTAMSPDQRLLAYSTIAPYVHVCNIATGSDGVVSIANVTDIHDAFDFSQASDDDDERSYDGRFGIWSLQWSQGGEQIIAGTSEHSVVVWDVERRTVAAHIAAHEDDVNAVAYLSNDPNVFVSGSDDSLIKVWDKRQIGSAAVPTRRGTAQRGVACQGVFPGHTQGLTHLHARGDGVHFISNCKDQTIKLWDIRRMMSRSEHRALPKPQHEVPGFDYRWQTYPARNRYVTPPHDVSVMTYFGHSVLQTLIRAYFSPQHTTAQRYIYSGSARGNIHIWDTLTGQPVSQLQYHKEVVRDCSWHPYDVSMMASVSWDGSIMLWDHKRPQHAIPPPGDDIDPW